MSNLEHLIENGIQATKRNGFDGFNECNCKIKSTELEGKRDVCNQINEYEK